MKSELEKELWEIENHFRNFPNTVFRKNYRYFWHVFCFVLLNHDKVRMFKIIQTVTFQITRGRPNIEEPSVCFFAHAMSEAIVTNLISPLWTYFKNCVIWLVTIFSDVTVMTREWKSKTKYYLRYEGPIIDNIAVRFFFKQTSAILGIFGDIGTFGDMGSPHWEQN